jgi:hypothetical protein
MIHGELKSYGMAEANGSKMECEITLHLRRGEPTYLREAILALDQAHKNMRDALRAWEKGVQ